MKFQPSDETPSLDNWSQLNEGISLARLDNTDDSPEAFMQDMMDWENILAAMQPFQAPMRPSTMPQILEYSSQPTGDSGESFATSDIPHLASDSTGLPIQSPSQGVQRIVVEPGQNQCQTCGMTFEGEASAVRFHINEIHIKKEKMNLYVEPGKVGRPKRTAIPTQATRSRKRRKPPVAKTPTSSSFQRASSFNPDHAQLADFRRLQAGFVIMLQENGRLVRGLLKVQDRLTQITNLLTLFQSLDIRIRAAETFCMWLAADYWERLMTTAIAFRGFARLGGKRFVYSNCTLDSKNVYHTIQMMVGIISSTIPIFLQEIFIRILVFLDDSFRTYHRWWEECGQLRLDLQFFNMLVGRILDVVSVINKLADCLEYPAFGMLTFPIAAVHNQLLMALTPRKWHSTFLIDKLSGIVQYIGTNLVR